MADKNPYYCDGCGQARRFEQLEQELDRHCDECGEETTHICILKDEIIEN